MHSQIESGNNTMSSSRPSNLLADQLLQGFSHYQDWVVADAFIFDQASMASDLSQTAPKHDAAPPVNDVESFFTWVHDQIDSAGSLPHDSATQDSTDLPAGD